MLDALEFATTERYQSNDDDVYATRTTNDADRDALAASFNCSVLRDDERTLLIDLDSEGAVDQFDRLWFILTDIVGLHALDKATIKRLRSRSGNTHMVISLHYPVYDMSQRLLLQAALGSDPKRLAFTLGNMEWGSGNPNILFRPLAS